MSSTATATAAGPPSASTTGPPVHSPPDRRPAPPVVDNRPSYLAWGLAYLVGYTIHALAAGPTPLLPLPSAVPVLVLSLCLLAATAVTTVNVARAQRGVTGPAAVPGKMFAGAWVTGFAALILLITALGRDLDSSRLSMLMFPAGSALVVGLLYLMGGALDRDVLQYTLGTTLALVGTAAVFLGLSGLYRVLALVVAGAYLTAATLEPRRRAAALRAQAAS